MIFLYLPRNNSINIWKLDTFYFLFYHIWFPNTFNPSLKKNHKNPFTPHNVTVATEKVIKLKRLIQNIWKEIRRKYCKEGRSLENSPLFFGWFRSPCFEFLGRAIELQIRQITRNVPYRCRNRARSYRARLHVTYSNSPTLLFLGIFARGRTTRGSWRIGSADVSNR